MRQLILVVILLIATLLRFWDLPNIPPSASLDEASIGWNAYSVLKTGGDEFGHFPLISQRGYDDYRRSTYLLLTTPFISILGLNVISVRLPAAILSVLTVFSVYLIVINLFSKKNSFAENTALLVVFLLAISPWHIYISRIGHESNACLSFLIFGVLFFLLGAKEKKWILLLASAIFLTLSMISYYSGQALIPLFVLGLFLIFRKSLLQIIKNNKTVLLYIGIFIVLLIPILWSIFSPAALIRFQGTSTFKPEAHPQEFANRVLLRNKAVEERNIFGAIFYNQHNVTSDIIVIERTIYTDLMNISMNATNFSKNEIDY